jgi:hypothetical protein
MRTRQEFLDALLPLAIEKPAVVTYNRLEPRPRSANFERSLRAEVRDALWMLARQWQLGEFKGNDASNAIQVQVQVESSRITRVSRLGAPAEAYDESTPLEAFVEAEPMPVDLRLCLEMGVQWLRLLRLNAVSAAGQDIFRGAYPLAMPAYPVAPTADAPQAAPYADRETWQWYSAARHGMDGAAFYRDLAGGLAAADVTFNAQPVPAGDVPGVNTAESAFKAWASALVYDPPGSAWSPPNLEYQVSVSAPRPAAPDQQDVLIADEYPGGALDWYSFDLDSNPEAKLAEGEGVVINDEVISSQTLTLLPAPVVFAGMPRRRWWEFEETRTDFGTIKPDKTDIAKLLLVEFGLAYGNDWLLAPFNLPVGSLGAVKALIVEDTFGQRTLIQPAAADEPDWQLFTLDLRGHPGATDLRLFIPPAATNAMQSQPIEQVFFTRDEMSNIVWAIESSVPDERGGGQDGYEAAIEVRRLLEEVGLASNPPPQPPPVKTDALIDYRLATGVPENWIPFVPVRIAPPDPEIRLRRGRMPRMLAGLNLTSVRPRGEILRPEPLPKAYTIEEQEVPRAGVTVKRQYQRVRWQGGSIFLWLGRQKQAGRGEASSGLRYDQIEDKPPAQG